MSHYASGQKSKGVIKSNDHFAKLHMAMMTVSVTNFVCCAIYHRKTDAAGQPYPSVISGFVAFQFKGKALINLFGKTLGILTSILAQRKANFSWEICF